MPVKYTKAQINQMMVLADTLFGLPESRVVHATSWEQGSWTDVDGEEAEGQGDIKFNMVPIKASYAECGTICCAVGWGQILFRDFRAIGPYPWLYSTLWADLIDCGADTPQAAAHRIWFWISRGMPDYVDFVDPSEWGTFVATNPIDECKAGAVEFQKGQEQGDEQATSECSG